MKQRYVKQLRLCVEGLVRKTKNVLRLRSIAEERGKEIPTIRNAITVDENGVTWIEQNISLKELGKRYPKGTYVAPPEETGLRVSIYHPRKKRKLSL